MFIRRFYYCIYYICIRHVTHSEHGAFSEFARDQIMQLPFLVPLPEEGSVFDYCLNLKQYQFVPWSQRGGEAANKSTRSSGYVSLPEVIER